MDWRAERLSLQAEIDTLKQEVQLLQVEKSSLEKARNPSFIHLSFSLSLSLSLSSIFFNCHISSW